MLNIYVLYTSYDVLLSMAIAASYPKDDNLMLFVRIPHALKKFTVYSQIFFLKIMHDTLLSRKRI